MSGRNRIVVDYGDTDDLFLLAVLDTETGFDVSDPTWPGPRVERLADGVTLKEASSLIADRENREGFVWRQWGSRLRVKVKQPDYVRKHRIVFGLNARVVWEVLSTGGLWQEFREGLPEEFREWADGCAVGLEAQRITIKRTVYDDYNDVIGLLPKAFSRKEFAQLALEREFPHLLFRVLDGKPIESECWKLVYPSADWQP